MSNITLFKGSADGVPVFLCPNVLITYFRASPKSKGQGWVSEGDGGRRWGPYHHEPTLTGAQASGCQGTPHLWYIGQPFQNGADSLEVIWHGDVGDPVGVHDLHATQLVVGCVDFSSQDLL